MNTQIFLKILKPYAQFSKALSLNLLLAEKGIISKLILISQHQPKEFRRLKQLSLQFNVDGLPLFNSVSGEFWPILCLLENVSCKIPFAVGIYYGKQKPTNADEYFTAFIS